MKIFFIYELKQFVRNYLGVSQDWFQVFGSVMSRRGFKSADAAAAADRPNVSRNSSDASDQTGTGIRTGTPNCDDVMNTSVRPSRPPPVGARPVNGIAQLLPVPPPPPPPPISSGSSPGLITNGGRRSRASVSPPPTQFQVFNDLIFVKQFSSSHVNDNSTSTLKNQKVWSF